MGCTIPVGRLGMISLVSVRGQCKSFLLYRRSGDVTAQSLKLLRLSCFSCDTRMQGESSDFTYLAIADVVLPGRYCLQSDDFATLLRTYSDPTHRQIAIPFITCQQTLFLQMTGNALTDGCYQ